MKISYLYRVAKNASTHKLNAVIEKVQQITGRDRGAILLDMILCTVRYGAGYHDYLAYALYDMTEKERDSIVTRLRSKKINAYLNDPDFEYIFDRKNELDRHFRDFLHRDFLDLKTASKDDVFRFIEDKETVVAKPNEGFGGHGIEFLHKKDFPDMESFYDYVREPDREFGVLEGVLIQHEDMKALNPNSVNCLRIVTVLDEDGEQVHIPFAVCKIGNGDSKVDNLGSGGMSCPVDLETHSLIGPAHVDCSLDYQAHEAINYDRHPITGIVFEGYKIPYFQEALELCKKAAHVVPQIRYVGWDIAICPDGPAIVEGNTYSGHDIYQLPEYWKGKPKVGLMPFFRQFVPGI